MLGEELSELFRMSHSSDFLCGGDSGPQFGFSKEALCPGEASFPPKPAH